MATATADTTDTAAANGNGKLSESDEAAVKAVNAGKDSDDLGEQGGKSVEDIAQEEETQLQLLDFGDTLSLTIRGKKPTDSTIKVKAISTPIKGQLGDIGDDETIVFVGRAQLEKLEMVSKRVEGKVTAKERRHVLDPIGFVPFKGVWAERLEALVDEMLEAQAEGGS